MSTIANEQELFTRFLATYPLSKREIDGVTWEYIICGEGERLLLLPGALATAETSFQYILAFETSYRVLAPSYPAAITCVAPLVDGLVALLEAEKALPTHVLGGSYSGLIAQCLVRRHPNAVCSLMLTNTGVPRPGRARAITLLLAGLALLPERTLRNLFKGFIRSFLPQATATHDFWRSYFNDLIEKWSREEYLSRLKVAIDFDRNYCFTPTDLCLWQQPILLVEAAADAIFGSAERAALRELYPDAERHIQKTSNHTASLDQSDQTIELMRTFLGEGRKTRDERRKQNSQLTTAN